jgi:branched-chain amino acid transport system substrate-binding protein
MDVKLVPENIGFGEDRKEVYAKAEKLIMQDDAFCVVAYLSPANAESLYPLFETAGRSLIVIDAGMNYMSEPPSKYVVHVSLQGIQAAYMAGKKAGQNGAKVIMATSFYDGGYRGPWAYHRGIADAGGAIVHHYVGRHKEEDFTVQPFLEAAGQHNANVTGACFSTYLAALFMNSLNKENGNLPEIDFYCSSYMVEEQTMGRYQLPASGRFYAYVPWNSRVENGENEHFISIVKEKKNKEANLFHLMGWEAGIITAQHIRQTEKKAAAIADVMAGWSYKSPRGVIKIHPEIFHAFGPMYYAELKQDSGNVPFLDITDIVTTTETEYLRIMNDKPEGPTSGWFNQYLCT